MRIRIRTNDKALKNTELYNSRIYFQNCQHNKGVIDGLESGIQRFIRIRIFTVRHRKIAIARRQFG
jgi:hypothetical protein